MRTTGPRPQPAAAGPRPPAATVPAPRRLTRRRVAGRVCGRARRRRCRRICRGGRKRCWRRSRSWTRRRVRSGRRRRRFHRRRDDHRRGIGGACRRVARRAAGGTGCRRLRGCRHATRGQRTSRRRSRRSRFTGWSRRISGTWCARGGSGGCRGSRASTVPGGTPARCWPGGRGRHRQARLGCDHPHTQLDSVGRGPWRRLRQQSGCAGSGCLRSNIDSVRGLGQRGSDHHGSRPGGGGQYPSSSTESAAAPGMRSGLAHRRLRREARSGCRPAGAGQRDDGGR